MVAKDLRIGNIVYYELQQKQIKVDSINIHECVDSPVFYKPIHIDKDVFNSFGFEEIYHTVFKKGNITLQFEGCINGYDKGWVWQELLGYMDGLRYAHQLQNFYFAINKEEL